jgi:hypothetical protein
VLRYSASDVCTVDMSQLPGEYFTPDATGATADPSELKLVGMTIRGAQIGVPEGTPLQSGIDRCT